MNPRVATSTSQSSSSDARVPPVVWALGGAVFQRIFPSREPPTKVRAVSLLLLVASAAFGVWSVRGFRNAATTVNPHHIHDVSTLVRTGAHSVSRNPMYTSLLGGLVSVALWRGRFAALLPVVAVWAALNQFQIRAEEAALAEAFGQEYQRYRDSVPRWL